MLRFLVWGCFGPFPYAPLHLLGSMLDFQRMYRCRHVVFFAYNGDATIIRLIDKIYIKCYTISIMKHILKKKLVHLGTLQLQQLEKISKQTGYATAELIRRSIDEYIEKRYPNILEVSNEVTYSKSCG